MQHNPKHISMNILQMANRQEAQSMFALGSKWRNEINNGHLSYISYITPQLIYNYSINKILKRLTPKIEILVKNFTNANVPYKLFRNPIPHLP